MMNNLFSMFDPSSYYMSMSWMSIFLPILAMNFKKFKNNKWNLMIKKIKSSMAKEINTLMANNVKKGNIITITYLFIFIFLSNFLALSPFTFTHTAHMSISFSMALVFWMSIMMFGLIFSFKHVMSHMVPMGTPKALMNFMVIIELTSNLIRPITLSVRLTANMVAGHLLMSLLANFSLMSTINLMSSIIPMLILTLLEMAVSIIQAYVFMTLVTMYHNEIF